MKLKCRIGWHQWVIGSNDRRCAHCPKHQRLMLYSNRTHEWADDVLRDYDFDEMTHARYVEHASALWGRG